MPIDKHHYSYQVCPHCKSKRIDKKQLSDVESGRVISGYLCSNCNKFFQFTKWIFDRAEMRRDYNALGKLLATKRGGL